MLRISVVLVVKSVKGQVGRQFLRPGIARQNYDQRNAADAGVTVKRRERTHQCVAVTGARLFGEPPRKDGRKSGEECGRRKAVFLLFEQSRSVPNLMSASGQKRTCPTVRLRSAFAKDGSKRDLRPFSESKVYRVYANTAAPTLTPALRLDF
jgi:hypothetical protein